MTKIHSPESLVAENEAALRVAGLVAPGLVRLARSADDLGDRGAVATSRATAARAAARGLPVVLLSADRAADCGRIAWMLDAPGRCPEEVIEDRARMCDARAVEVREHLAARARDPFRTALWRLRRRLRPPRPVTAARTGMAPVAHGRDAPLGATPRVSVILPTRDRADLLSRVLVGLRGTEWPDLEIVVVDNGSRQADALALLEADDLRVERLPIGFNFSRLCNRGAFVARGEVLVFLNDDIEIRVADWLGPLVEALRNPKVGPVGCVLTFPDGTIQHAGIAIGPRGPVHPLTGVSTDDPMAVPALVSGPRTAVTAACLAIRSGAFWALGGFDPLFARDYNDVDLCLRARSAGYAVLVEAGVVLVHHESASRGRALHPDTVGDWMVMRSRWAEVLAAVDPWWPVEVR